MVPFVIGNGVDFCLFQKRQNSDTSFWQVESSFSYIQNAFEENVDLMKEEDLFVVPSSRMK